MRTTDFDDTLRAAITTRRRDLAAVFRATANLGLHEGTCNHFSAVIPGRPDLYLINPFGLHFSEIRASDLLLLDEAGAVVEGDGEVEITAFHIHSEIHRSNPGASCILHTHMPYATAITATRGGRLAMCHQNAARFHGRVAYDTASGYQGLALGSAEGRRMSEALGDKSVLLLEGHGPLVVGSEVDQAFDDLYYLERAAMIQVLAESSGRPLIEIDDALAHSTAMEFRAQAAEYARRHLDATKRILDRQDPTWRD